MKVIRKVLSSLTVTLDGCTYGWIDGQTIIIKRCFVRVKVHEGLGGGRAGSEKKGLSFTAS